MLEASERAFDALCRADWLEAFAAHSVIGAPRAGDSTGAREQSGMAAAGNEQRTALAAGNLEYHARFGFVFLIRASGAPRGSCCSSCALRIANPPEVEFANACAQQREITALRLTGLIPESLSA